MTNPSKRQKSKVVRALGSCCAFAVLALPIAVAATAAPASASTTGNLQGCYTSWNSSGGYANCVNTKRALTAWASADCFAWPGDTGAKNVMVKGETLRNFSHIACSTSVTQGFINVNYGGHNYQSS